MIVAPASALARALALSLCIIWSLPAPRVSSSWSSRVLLRVASVAPSSINHPTGDPNFAVLESFPSNLPYDLTSPFLLSHEWGEATKSPLAKHAPDPGPPPAGPGNRHVGWHPHRGFDILSYIKQGRGSHADSMGNVAIVRPGGVQWMRTGSGVEHAEGGGNPEGAEKHGFQLWINAAAHDKMKDPAYGTVQPEDIPEARSDTGGLCRFLVAGDRGAAFQDRSDFSIVDVELPNEVATYTVDVPDEFTHVIVYPYQGLGKISGTVVRPQYAAVMMPPEDGKGPENQNGIVGADGNIEVVSSPLEADYIHNQNDDKRTVIHFESLNNTGAAFLVFMGKPMNEPVSWRGPIVMTTKKQIATAYRELRSGGFLKKRVNFDYRTMRPIQGPPVKQL